MQVCFGGGAWPASLASRQNFCAAGLQGETGATAAVGGRGWDALDDALPVPPACIHRTNCTDEPDVGDNTACYCGTDVSLQACLGPNLSSPTGKCLAEFTNAMESSQLTQTNAGVPDRPVSGQRRRAGHQPVVRLELLCSRVL